MSKLQGWKIDGYRAVSEDGKYALWIANGFLYFKDHEPHYPRHTLLAGASLIDKYKLWREIKRERKHRLKSFLDNIGQSDHPPTN